MKNLFNLKINIYRHTYISDWPSKHKFNTDITEHNTDSPQVQSRSQVLPRPHTHF